MFQTLSLGQPTPKKYDAVMNAAAPIHNWKDVMIKL